MGFGSKMKKSIGGVFFGILLVPGSICLHAWNEYRTVHRTRGLNEAQEVAQTVENIDQVNPELDGKLVHLSGEATTEEVLMDQKFGVSQQAIRLKRHVEMYQWDEHEKRDDNDNVSYSYREGWHEGRIQSESFHRSGHENPKLPFRSEDQIADLVELGAYQLPDRLVKSMRKWLTLTPDESSILETAGREEEGNFLVSNDQVFWSTGEPRPNDPQIGDVRIEFRMIGPGDVSLLAKQSSNSFAAFETSNGEKIECLYDGLLSKDEVIDKQRTENAMLAWGLRALGAFLCVAGFGLIMGPVQTLVGWVPLLGDLTKGAIFLASLLLGLSISIITIGVSWIAVRPLLGIALLLIAGVGIYAIFRMRGKKEEGILQGDAPPPVVDDSMFVN